MLRNDRPLSIELISTIQNQALPFLVAVKRQPHHTEKSFFRTTIGRPRSTLPGDEVYGLAFASSRQPLDVILPVTSVSDTAYVELYVRKDVCNKGVGSALLDVALSKLIPIPYYFPSTGGTFVVSPEAVLGWRKSVTEVQVWLGSTGAETDTQTTRVITWLKSQRWGFEVLDDVMPGPENKLVSRVARLRRRCAEQSDALHGGLITEFGDRITLRH